MYNLVLFFMGPRPNILLPYILGCSLRPMPILWIVNVGLFVAMPLTLALSGAVSSSAMKGSVDEEPVSDHWHNSNANDAAGLENDHADKKEKRGAFQLLESFQSLDFQWQLAGG